MLKIIIITTILLLLTGCSVTAPPKHPKNICKIFRQYPSWYWATKKTRHEWGVPISVQMAIVYQESHFVAHAVPLRQRLFGFIPWLRSTTASGYAQALQGTWREYLKSVGEISAGRNEFSDAVDFIGWYVHLIHRQLHLSLRDVRDIYIAYHEGIDGYRHHHYLHKRWLLRIANKVNRQAQRYRSQLLRCEKRLPKKPWWYM